MAVKKQKRVKVIRMHSFFRQTAMTQHLQGKTAVFFVSDAFHASLFQFCVFT